jgi:shikimate dehydrogenase
VFITGIIGYPLKTTFSPMMHNAVFKELNIGGIYLPLPVEKQQLKKAMTGLRALGFRGVNITTPYKEKVIEFLDEIEGEAGTIGAVNTVVVENNRLIGYNTDIYGFNKSLHRYKIDVRDKNVMLIGAGGAARACAHVIEKKSPKKFLITNRTNNKSEIFPQLFNVITIDFAKIDMVIPIMDIVINATSVNMQRRVIPLMKKQTVYYDVNYKFRMPKQRGIKMINGLSMLVFQGAQSFSLWTGKEMPIAVVEKIVGLKNG